MSMEDKRALVDKLAVKIGYHSSDLDLSPEDENFVWGLIDFGYRNDLIIEGRCSLKETMEFDSEVWEKQMDEDIEKLKNLEAQYDGSK